MPENGLRFIKRVIYNLKRRYGGPVDIYQNVVGTPDYATGQRSTTKNLWSVAKAIRLPRDIHRDALFDLTGNRVFAYGNFVQLADRIVIIDRQDLPFGFILGQENWYFVIDGHHYEIVKHDEFDNKAALYVVLKELAGQALERIVSINVTTPVNVTTNETIIP